jgi:hypothetical protein
VRGNIIISIDIFSKKINILSYSDELMNRVGYSKIPPSGHLFLPTCAMKTKKKPRDSKLEKIQTKPRQRFVDGKLSIWDGTSGNNQ